MPKRTSLMAHMHPIEPKNHPTTTRAALSARTTTAQLSDKVGEALKEIARHEAELEFLEERLPPLQAKLDATLRPLLAGIIELRKELVRIVERQLLAAPRRSPLHRDGADLIAHLVSDLEERFGVDVRPILHRWDDSSPQDEEIEEPQADDFSWARPENHAPRGRETDPHRNRKHEPVDPEAAAKGIYRSLARELHPDKTRDETERLRRTTLMQNLTSAWRERDLGTLLKLLHAHGSDEAKSDAMDAASLRACLKGVEETLESLRRKVRNLRHQGLPGGVVDWMPILRDAKLFEKLLRRHRAPARQELEDLTRLKHLWQNPGGLDRFFREVPDHLWKDAV